MTVVGTPKKACCWARTLLAAPPDPDWSPQLSCTSPRCAKGNCRRGGDGSGDGSEIAPWERTVQEITERAPEPRALTEAILRRLAQDGVLTPVDSEHGEPPS